MPFDDSTWDGSEVQQIANAIAGAEGYFVSGSLPARYNNPGGIEDPQGRKIHYAASDIGWRALLHQVVLILTDRSRVYRSSMSIAEIAKLWTGGDQPDAWAHNVAVHLGIAPTDTLTYYLERVSTVPPTPPAQA